MLKNSDVLSTGQHVYIVDGVYCCLLTHPYIPTHIRQGQHDAVRHAPSYPPKVDLVDSLAQGSDAWWGVHGGYRCPACA